MAEFIACLDAKWYLQSYKAIEAPYLDILSIHKMHLYKDVCAKPDTVEAEIILKTFLISRFYNCTSFFVG